MNHPIISGLVDAARAHAPWVIAHRGDSAFAPENTLDAARLAREKGADGWEFDVQLTRDGIPVVLHDESLARTTDAASRFALDPRRPAFFIGDFDLAELRELDAGHWFVAAIGADRDARHFGTEGEISPVIQALCRSGRVQIPTLREALALTVELGWFANVELKAGPATDRTRLLRATLDAITDARAERNVWVSSFDHALIGTIARLKQVPTALLIQDPLHEPVAYIRHAQADALHMAVSAMLTEQLGALHDASIPVLVYTINEPQPLAGAEPGSGGGVVARLTELGVAGIFSDTPEPLLWIQSRQRTT